MISINMTVAKDIWRDKLRAARTPVLEALDVEYQRADESADSARKAEIISTKQTLRDAPADPRIAAATTVEDLLAVWPSALDTTP